MDRSNTLSRVAALCRADHWRANFAVGFLCQALPTEGVAELLAALEEHVKVTEHPAHYQAYLERWGRLPD